MTDWSRAMYIREIADETCAHCLPKSWPQHHAHRSFHWGAGVIQVRHAEYGEYEYLSPMHLYVRNTAPLGDEISQIDGVTSVRSRVSAPGQIYIDRDQTDAEPGERHNAIAFGVDIAAEDELLSSDDLVVAGTLPRSGEREAGVALAEKIGLV